MTKILEGKPVAEALKEEIRERVAKLKEEGVNPCIAVLRVGEDPSDVSYERGIIKNAESVNIETKLVQLAEDSSTDEVLSALEELNTDDKVSGIIVFRPLPKQIDEEAIRVAIDPDKDVDCMHPLNLGRIFEGDTSKLLPATPVAAMKLMEHYGIELSGKNVTVVNRSLVFGRPIAMLLLGANATPTIAHSRTQDIESILKESDVCIVATGQAATMDKSYFNEDSIIIDVGVNTTAEGKLSGDANWDEVEGYVAQATPVPGGVGAVTNTVLLEQVVRAAEIQKAK